MKIGDRVRLTPRCAKAFSKGKPHSIKWETRCGIIVCITKRGDIGVRWHDRVTIDMWPHQAIMVIRNRPLNTKASASRLLPAKQAASCVGRESPDGD